MKLSQKLDEALRGYGLQSCGPYSTVQSEPIEPIGFATFDTLQQLIQNANDVEPDDDGVRVVHVKDIEVEDINLPMAQGKFIIDDIQKHKNGYEVHLLENPDGCKT
jgi:hypothetical protein